MEGPDSRGRQRLALRSAVLSRSFLALLVKVVLEAYQGQLSVGGRDILCGEEARNTFDIRVPKLYDVISSLAEVVERPVRVVFCGSRGLLRGRRL